MKTILVVLIIGVAALQVFILITISLEGDEEADVQVQGTFGWYIRSCRCVATLMEEKEFKESRKQERDGDGHPVLTVRNCDKLLNANSQCLRSSVVGAPGILPANLVESNGVAASLADTLSLLTVSSLLAEKLPFGYPLAAPIANIAPIAPIAPMVTGYGCGCDSVYGYPYNTYLI